MKNVTLCSLLILLISVFMACKPQTTEKYVWDGEAIDTSEYQLLKIEDVSWKNLLNTRDVGEEEAKKAFKKYADAFIANPRVINEVAFPSAVIVDIQTFRPVLNHLATLNSPNLSATHIVIQPGIHPVLEDGTMVERIRNFIYFVNINGNSIQIAKDPTNDLYRNGIFFDELTRCPPMCGSYTFPTGLTPRVLE